MYGIYGNIYHQYTPNVSIYIIYTIRGSYGSCKTHQNTCFWYLLIVFTITNQICEQVGGLEHEFDDFPYIGNNHPNWLIFFRGVAQPPTSNQWLIVILMVINDYILAYNNYESLLIINKPPTSWLVVSNMNVIFHFIYGMSSQPHWRTSSFFKMLIAPPTSQSWSSLNSWDQIPNSKPWWKKLQRWERNQPPQRKDSNCVWSEPTLIASKLWYIYIYTDIQTLYSVYIELSMYIYIYVYYTHKWS